MQIFKAMGSKLDDNFELEEIVDEAVFSSTDIVAYISVPGVKTYRIGNLSLLSISTHRDKFPVTSLGRIRVKGFTSGHRTVGGTLVFSSFDKSAWHKATSVLKNSKNPDWKLDRYKQFQPIEMFLADELPPFDISVTFVNEYGNISYTGVLGVTILDEGETYSIDNVSIMESYSYMAMDRIPFQSFSFASIQNESDQN